MPPPLKSPIPACALALGLSLGVISACSSPGGEAVKLNKKACEQAAASFDLQSMAQLDSLRKSLGVAPDVNPIEACKLLGAEMGPAKQARASTTQDRGGDKSRVDCDKNAYNFFEEHCSDRSNGQEIQPVIQTKNSAPANLVHPPLCFPRC